MTYRGLERRLEDEAGSIVRQTQLILQQHAVVQIRVGTLVRANRSVRKHSEKNIQKLCRIVQRYGTMLPVVLGSNNKVLDGEARIEVARRLGIAVIPAIQVAHLSEAEQKAFRIAFNKSPDWAEWDEDALRVEFDTILELESDFDLGDTGFETGEIDVIMADDEENEAGGDAADVILQPSDGPGVTRSGDVWLFGDRHRLLCGDTKDPQSFQRVLAGAIARMVFTDQPYNIRIKGVVGGLGQTQHREFHEASGEMGDAEFEKFTSTIVSNHADVCADGGLLYLCIDWRHIEMLLRVCNTLGLQLVNICVWVKNNGGMGSFYRSRHELVCVLKKGDEPHLNNVQLGSQGRYRTNVFEYAGVNSFGRERMAQLQAHPTAKPVDLVADVIRDCTERWDVVLDGFAGSGTTLIAAEKTGRRSCSIEIDPAYVDGAIARFKERFGIEAVHEESGLTLAQLATQRLEEAEEAPTAKPATTGRLRLRQRPYVSTTEGAAQ
jgi:DNA modification methylase